MDKLILVGLDRDGTINIDSGFFGKDDDWKEKLRFHKGVIEGIQLLNKYDEIKIVILTNQGSGIARGIYSFKRTKEVNEYILKLLLKQGIKIDNLQSCNYVGYDYAEKHKIPDYKNNKWVVDINDKRLLLRKPNIGMFEKAVKELGFSLEDFNKIYYLGDKIKDIETGINANGKGILVYNEGNDKDKKEIESRNDENQVVADNFYKACEFIIKDIKN